ncbi:hypothetical protein [Amycolatopsis solani]|uniref:hypothetical protein n=1 Tax=Amycolatopsis solani TaxID=3028615 RepID=UPI0025B1E541|nr:hypothetical protein [Amycolatopsis sp. MEP2-6]
MPARELVRRCLVAAVSGVLGTLALWALPAKDLCTGAACFFVALLAVPLMVLGAGLLAYALMALARVRPAWPVALVGPATLLAVTTTVVVPGSLPAFLALIAGSYAFAALVTADELPNAWRVALAAPVVVLFGWGVVLPIVL